MEVPRTSAARIQADIETSVDLGCGRRTVRHNPGPADKYAKSPGIPTIVGAPGKMRRNEHATSCLRQATIKGPEAAMAMRSYAHGAASTPPSRSPIRKGFRS